MFECFKCELKCQPAELFITADDNGNARILCELCHAEHQRESRAMFLNRLTARALEMLE